jgi:predicted short-subunit dehydrogenase-like oxidoreductase (DUF2520 family)
MRARPGIAIVGAGKLANALAVSLRGAGYAIEEVIARSGGASFKNAQKLARKTGARFSAIHTAQLDASLVWFCVPDSEIAHAAQTLANADWRRKIALHSSGALASDDLRSLRRGGAAVASVHPLMTFVRNSRPALAGVPFAIEGDAAAVRMARRLVNDLGGRSYSIRKSDKAAYHAWGTFASPLFTALLATTERVAGMAGVRRKSARDRMIPILLQTLANYACFGAAGAFSGPIVRGDFDTVKRHLRVLRAEPVARELYLALARAALRYLPTKKQADLRKALRA